jgi:Ca2+-transporting ATPase
VNRNEQVVSWAEPDAEQVLRALGTSLEGLSLEEARVRLQRFGPNVPPRVPRTPWYWHLARNFVHLFAVLLWVAALLAWVSGMPELAAAIVLVIAINGLFSFWQEYQAERAAEALEAFLPQQVVVRRGGTEFLVPANEVVPGDLLVLRAGEAIAADARIVRSDQLRVDLSHLTGESRPVPRVAEPQPAYRGTPWQAANLVFAGSFVTDGTGEAVVFATGAATQFGQLAQLAQRQPERPSPLERELARVVRAVSVLAFSLGMLSFFAAELWGRLAIRDAFLFALGIIVANVPEGLLPTLTLALAVAARAMARKNAVVKRLSTIEALGATTVILTDKTGTLTLNEMTVREVWAGGVAFVFTGSDQPRAETAEGAGLGADADTGLADLRRLLRCAATCCHVEFVPPQRAGDRMRPVGDPTEIALIVAAAKVGFPLDHLRQIKRIAELPFDSARKRMTVIAQIDGTVTACSKGAWSEVAPRCRFARLHGSVVPLETEQRSVLQHTHDRLAARGYRVLAVAERPLHELPTPPLQRDDIERELVFLGFVAMEDPPRPEVPAAIAACKRAGIRVCMVTGDDPLTAVAIAQEIGLHAQSPLVVTGADLDRYHAAALETLLRSHRDVLFARVSPEHKLRLVQAFQRLGEVVAVTGDGVNDAPALRGAEIGVAMGATGTDVAREAGDMILADDNFATIVTAIEYGRAVFDNVRKFVTYIFASNVPEIVPFLFFVLGGFPLPLTVLQILAVDLGTDLFPALALGREPAEPGVMERPPRSRQERILSVSTLLRAYAWLGLIEATLCMGAYFYAYWLAGWVPPNPLPTEPRVYATATTMTFAGIVACQVGNVLACRSDRLSLFALNWTGSHFLWLAIAAEVALCCAFMYIPFAARVFGFAPLSLQHWLPLLAYPVLLLGLEEGRKALVRAIEARSNRFQAGNAYN